MSGLLLVLSLCAPDVVGRLVVSPDARLYRSFGSGRDAVELSSSQGLGFGARGHELLGRGGVRMAGDGNVEALVVGLGWVVSPFAWRVRPLLGA